MAVACAAATARCAALAAGSTRVGGGRRGEARGSRREAGERRGKWGSGTWLGSGQRRGGRVAHMAEQRRRHAAEEGEREVDKGD
jgi:hypothetical protein